LEREQHGEVPGQRVHAQTGAVREHVVRERQQGARRVVSTRVQLDVAVDVTAEDDHRVPGAGDGVPQRREVGVGVDQEGGAPGGVDAPAVFPFAKHARKLTTVVRVGVGGLRLPEPVAGGLEPFEGSKFGRLGVVDTEVRYGGVVVGRSPQVRDRTDAGAFLVFSEPLPVGTSLTLKIDEKEQPAVVTEVVESADASAAGMRVRFGTAAAKTAPASRPPERAAAPAPAPAPAAAAPAPVAAAPAPAP